MTSDQEQQASCPQTVSSGDYKAASLPSHTKDPLERTNFQLGVIFPAIKDALDWIGSHKSVKESSLKFEGRKNDQFSNCTNFVAETIAQKPCKALKEADQIQILCTGSMHLVGHVLGLLEPKVTSNNETLPA